jgi:site-specific recombinase XerD
MSRRLPSILTTSEIDALLAAARAAADAARTPARQQATWRDFVMIQTGLLAGPRVAELCALEVADIDLAGAVLAIRHGKGDKDRNVSIAVKLLPALREWIGTRKSGWLFPGPNGKRLCTRAFQRRLVTLARAAGIVKATHPHMLRHSFATALLKRGVNLRIIQTLLGHSSVAVTEIYTHIDTSDMKLAVDLL